MPIAVLRHLTNQLATRVLHGVNPTVQTPQAFKVELLVKAFAAVRKKGKTVTDEAAAVELLKKQVRLVPTTLPNIKITTPEDLALAGLLLRL